MYLCFYSMLSWWNFFCFLCAFRFRESIPTSHKCVTSTDDLETQGHVMLYVTFTNFGCACPKSKEFFLFLMFFGSGNPFQLVTNAWSLRMTLKLKVTWCCTWPLLTSAVLDQKRWIFFLFLMFFGSGNPFQLVTNAWFSRMTLKLKVMWCCTWPFLTSAVLDQKRWIFFVSNVVSGQEIHSN